MVRKWKAGSAKAWLAGATGLLLGCVINRLVTNGNAIDLIGAAMGASIAVLGAVVYDGAKAKRERAELQHLVAGCIQKILDATQPLIRIEELHPDRVVTDAEMKTLLRDLQHRWVHLALFSPYDKLGEFRLVGAVADVDAECRDVLYLIEDNPPPPQQMLARMRWGRRSVKSLQNFGSSVEQACERALVELGWPLT